MNRTTISASKSKVKPLRRGAKINPTSLFNCMLSIKQGRALPVLPIDSKVSVGVYISMINRFRQHSGIKTRLSMGMDNRGRRVIVCKLAD